MKRLVSMMLVLLMTVSFAACAGNSGANSAANGSAAATDGSQAVNSGSSEASKSEASVPETSSAAEASKQEESPADASGKEQSAPDAQENSSEAPDTSAEESSEPHSSVLVVVFSATGTTKGVAEKIAAITGADLYEIKAAQEYTSADLNWNDRGSRSTLEQNDKNARPEIGSETISLAGYETIYIGFPIWWGEEPRILDTFVESYSFDGITMIPFCTSASSGIGRSGRNLAENAGSGSWRDGRRFSGSVSEDDLRAWIGSLQ